jgi:deoxyribonuclease-4
MLLGAHQSIANGPERAFATAVEDGCEAIQVFTKNASQWREPALTPGDRARFREARARSPIAGAKILSHDSYLINLCAKDETLRERSREALLAEALRCEELGIEHVVLHPGAHTGDGPERALDHIVENLAWVLERTRGAAVSLLVENTAAQGTVMASRFDEIGAILRGVEDMHGKDAQERLGVCIDTCHAFAAGYDLASVAGFDAAWGELERHIGASRVKAMHLNDSQKGLGCRVDRHERIGEGELGEYPFWRLQNEPALSHVVAVLETPPVETDAGEDRAFRRQLDAMRRYVSAPAPKTKPKPEERPFALEVQEAPKPSRRRPRR